MPGRFRFSLPPSRHHGDPWFRIGSLDVTTTVLVALISAVTIFVYAADGSLLEPFALIPDRVLDGQVWRLVTWPFVSVPDPSVLWTIITIAIFWWFGRELEAEIGRVRMAVLLACIVVGSALVATGLDVVMFGLRSVELAIFVLFIAHNPRVPFFFGIPAWVVGAILVAAEFLQRIGNRQFEQLWVTLVALGMALLIGRAYGLASELTWIPNLAPNAGRRRPASRRTQRSRAPKARKQKSSQGGSKGRSKGRSKSNSPSSVVTGPWAPPSPSMSADQMEVDRLLDKISAQGIDSLSAEERRRLKDASERLRRDRG